MLKEFREFAVRGNAIDMAVGVIVGAAFGKIVTSMTNDLLMPVVGLIVGKVNFSHLFLDLSGTGYATLEAAKAAGAPTINYGVFLNTIIDFTIVAFAMFLLIRQMNRLFTPKTNAPAPTKDQELLTEIRDLLKAKP